MVKFDLYDGQRCRYILNPSTLPQPGKRSSFTSNARVTEIKSSSNKSFDDAIKSGLVRAGKTLTKVKSAWIENQEVMLGCSLHCDSGNESVPDGNAQVDATRAVCCGI